MRKSYLLKYISFVLMLASLVRLFFGFMMINFFATALTMGAVEKQNMKLAVAAIVLIVLSFFMELVSGFTGVLHWNEPLRAGRCTVWGLATLLVGLAGNLMQGITGYGISYVAWITGIAAPGLYTLAALYFYLRRQIILKE